MHGQSPKMVIMVKKAAMGDEHPDFSGPGFAKARKMMIMSASGPEEPETIMEEPSESPDMASKMTPDDHAEIMEVVKELRKASKKHAGQADRLEALCERMMGKSDDETPDPDVYGGGARELE